MRYGSKRKTEAFPTMLSGLPDMETPCRQRACRAFVVLPKKTRAFLPSRLLPELLHHVRFLPGIVVHKEGPRDPAIDVAVQEIETLNHPGRRQIEELFDDLL